MEVGGDPLASVRTAPEFAAALRALKERTGRSYADFAREVRGLPPARDRVAALPTSTVSDMMRTGRPRREVLITFLTCCGLTPDAQSAWLAARERIERADAKPPRGAVRASDLDPRRWGVHAAITVDGASVDTPPSYVVRDLDVGPDGLRARVQRAAHDGGFVLLVGGSCVGKTRSAVEAVRAVLPDWWVVQPRNDADLRVLADGPCANVVVWLDELQNFLESTGDVEAEIARLLTGGNHTVILGTLWPDRYGSYSALPAVGETEDRYERERQLLKLADVVVVNDAFSAAERERAGVRAADDPRLALALRGSGHGVTQTLAGGPLLLQRWQAPPDAYCRALIDAAVDASRLGVRSPLPQSLLHSLTPAYCTDVERASAPADWFDHALRYVTARLHGAVSVLVPASVDPEAPMGRCDGYRVADYVLEHAGRARRTQIPSEAVWQRYADDITSPADLYRLGHAAEHRRLLRQAEALYRAAADGGHRHASSGLSTVLSNLRREREAIDGAWSVSPDEGEPDEDWEEPDPDEEAAWAGDVAPMTCQPLPVLDGDVVAGLRAAIDGGQDEWRHVLAHLLIREGRLDEAEAALVSASPDLHPDLAMICSHLLVDVLRSQGRPAEAEVLLRRLCAGHGSADPVRLAELLEDQGRYQEAEAALRPIGENSSDGRDALAGFLERRGRLDEAEAVLRGEDDDWVMRSSALPDFLERHGRVEDAYQERLAMIVAEPCENHGDFDRPLSGSDVRRLETDLLGALDAGGSARLWHALAHLYAGAERADEALTAAGAAIEGGDHDAGETLGEYLAERGDDEGAVRAWRDAIASGYGRASMRCVGHLYQIGESDSAERLNRYGLNPDGSIARQWWAVD